MSENITQSEWKEMSKYMDTLITLRLKYLLVLSSGFLGGTGIYYHNKEVYCKYLLVLSWASMTLGLSLLLFHFEFTIRWAQKKMKNENTELLGNIIDTIPWITDAFFLLGVILFVFFQSLSL